MSPEQQARLFQPFSQASEGIWAAYGGSGLGLVIVQRLLALMGGTVRVDPEGTALGRGTTMVVELQLPTVGVLSPGTATHIPLSFRTHTLTVVSAAHKRG